MWLLKAPRHVIRICDFCGGSFGLVRPARNLCSTYCVAWYENEKYHPPTVQYELPLKVPERNKL